jgi:hypothetical protein
MNLRKVIAEALEHDVAHPGFKTSATTDSLEGDLGQRISQEFKDEHDTLQKLHALHNDINTSATHAAIGEYTASHSHVITKWMVDPASTAAQYNQKSKYFDTAPKDTHAHITKVLADPKPLPHDTHVYSGVTGYDPSEALQHGSFHTPTHTSTSLNPKIAAAHVGDTTKEHHIIHFHLPKGFKGGRYISEHSSFPGELEYLMKPGQNWKVTNHSVVDRPTDIWGRARPTRHVWSVVPHNEQKDTI